MDRTEWLYALVEAFLSAPGPETPPYEGKSKPLFNVAPPASGDEIRAI